MPQSPYYYGVQRKALTGMGYGPYYGQRYMGGQGQAATGQGTATELSEKYATEPAVSRAGEQPGSQTKLTGQMGGPIAYEGGTPTTEQKQDARTFQKAMVGMGLMAVSPASIPAKVILSGARLAVDRLFHKHIPSLYETAIAEGLTTPEEAARGATKSAEYSAMGIFGSERSSSEGGDYGEGERDWGGGGYGTGAGYGGEW